MITVQSLFYLENILCLVKVMMTDWTGLKVEDEIDPKNERLLQIGYEGHDSLPNIKIEQERT